MYTTQHRKERECHRSTECHLTGHQRIVERLSIHEITPPELDTVERRNLGHREATISFLDITYVILCKEANLYIIYTCLKEYELPLVTPILVLILWSVVVSM